MPELTYELNVGITGRTQLMRKLVSRGISRVLTVQTFFTTVVKSVKHLTRLPV